MKSEDIFRGIIRKVTQHPGAVLIVAVLLTVISTVAIAFKFEIRSDIKDLMPEHALSVIDTYAISDRMGSIQTLQIIVETPSLNEVSAEQKQSEAYKRCQESIKMSDGFLAEKPPIGEHWCDSTLVLFGSDFVMKLRELDTVGNVAFFNDKSFFEDNILLYAGVDELERAYDKIDETLTEAREQSGNYKACLMVESDPANCDALKPRLKSEAEDASDAQKMSLKDELMARYKKSELAAIDTLPLEKLSDGAWLLRLNIRFKNSTTSLKAIKQETKRIDKIVEDLDMTGKYDSTLKLVYTGSLDEMKGETDAIVNDIARSIGITIFSILALLAIFFRSIRGAVRIFTPLIMSTICSLGITFVAIGYLNIITAFIFAILIGLGIDFGIHLYSRWRRERSLGASVEDAMITSVVETGTPIFYGALTTSAVFFTLMLGSFKGFTEFGFVAGIGVLLAFITMCTVLPAMTILMERVWPSKFKVITAQKRFSREQSKRFSPAILAISLAGIAFGLYCVTCIQNILFEENFNRLRLRETATASQDAKIMRYKKSSLRPTSPAYVVMDNPEQVAALNMIINRDKEYHNFQRYRRLATKVPDTFRFIDRTFGEVLPYAGQNRSIPMYTTIFNIAPEFYADDFIPIYATYGSDKSKYLIKIREVAALYPNLSDRLSADLNELLSDNRFYDALPIVAWEQHILPRSLWQAIPTQRSSQQYNTISDYASIYSYLPGTASQQAERLAIIKRIAERTSDRNIRFLPTDEKNKIKNFRDRYTNIHELSFNDLPSWVKLQFKESGLKPLPPRQDSGVDYAFGNVGVIYQSTSTYAGRQAHMITHDVRSIRVDDKRLTAATGAFVYSDMLNLVKTDGVKTSVMALILIIVIVFFQQKNPILALVVAVPVSLGLTATIAVMSWFNLKLGLFNIVMLPVTLGIGIDGSIYLLQRYQQLGRGSILEAMRQVSGPVFMSSATTVIGFGSMMFSQHMGLNTMGQLASIGISLSFCATFIIQPGLILICEKCGLKAIADHDYVDSTPEPDHQNDMTSSDEKQPA